MEASTRLNIVAATRVSRATTFVSILTTRRVTEISRCASVKATLVDSLGWLLTIGCPPWPRARREAARRRKSECKVNLDILNSFRSSASKRLQKLYPRTTWRMDLCQLTAYEHFRCVNMRAITFLFVDQSSSRDSRLL